MSKKKFPKVNMFTTVSQTRLTLELLEDNKAVDTVNRVITLPEYLQDTIVIEIFAAGYSKDHIHITLLPSRRHLQIELTVDYNDIDRVNYFKRIHGYDVYFGKVHLSEATRTNHTRVIELPLTVSDDYTAVLREDGVTMVVLRRREDLSGAEPIQLNIEY